MAKQRRDMPEAAEWQKADALFPGDFEELPGSLAQRVYHVISEAIFAMRYPPGAVLKKAEISAQLGVSRAPISEAVARLAAEGLVDIVPQSSTKVSRLSMPEIREASFLREALELAAVERVAAIRTEDQLAELTRNIRLQQVLAADGDYAGFFAADEAFHALLMSFTGYRGVASTVAAVSLQLRRARLLLLPETGRPASVVEEHEAILAAIRDQNPKAARETMKAHLAELISRIEPLEQRHPNYFRAR